MNTFMFGTHFAYIFCQGRHLSLQKKLSFKNQNVRISKIIESSSHTPF